MTRAPILSAVAAALLLGFAASVPAAAEDARVPQRRLPLRRRPLRPRVNSTILAPWALLKGKR